jgi:hypothetical protein
MSMLSWPEPYGWDVYIVRILSVDENGNPFENVYCDATRTVKATRILTVYRDNPIDGGDISGTRLPHLPSGRREESRS